MKKIILGKKMITLVSLLAVLGGGFFLKNQYNQMSWQKSIKTPEHQLQLGSYIFTKSLEDNGSQWYKMGYFVYKVVHLDKDFVKLAVIRQLSLKDHEQGTDFSMSSEQYEAFKKSIIHTTLTGILVEDLYIENSPPFVLNAYLLKKYPSLRESKFYYEDVADALKNKPAPSEVTQLNDYISLVYSREQIIKNGQLIPYTMENYYKNQQPELYPNPNIAQDIQLIINKK